MKVALVTITLVVLVIIITEVELARARRTQNAAGNREQEIRSEAYTRRQERRPCRGARRSHNALRDKRPRNPTRKPSGPRHVVGKPGSRNTNNRLKPCGRMKQKKRKPAGTGSTAPAAKPPKQRTGQENGGKPHNGTETTGKESNHSTATGKEHNEAGAMGHGMMGGMMYGGMGMGMGMGMGYMGGDYGMGMGMGGMGMGMGMMGGKAGMYGTMANQLAKSVGGAAVGVAREANAAKQGSNLDPGLEDTPGGEGEGKDDKEGGDEDKNSKKKDSKEENNETTDKKSEKPKKEEEGNKEKPK
ncbi:uncharacterized protein LOC142588392 isoform X2 [Dermacentor variabilis]|uniref:uncharacterized protein LOC142588392 isoform X2 n=1 Tax=Dermacentor variabilis TaxID=34621 RepID=UPI003F5B5374